MGNHKNWRKLMKKMRRKRIRRKNAEIREELLRKVQESPSYTAQLAEQKLLEEFEEAEKERIYQKQYEAWLEEEENAKKRWEVQQKKLKHAKEEKEKQLLLIKEEWDREQQKLKEKIEEKRREKEKKEKEQMELMQRVEDYVNGETDVLPADVKAPLESQPGAPICPFFLKVGACRFRETCSRNHIRPGVSNCLLFPGFYSNFMMDHRGERNEYDTDISLEYDESETYHHFLNFYEDVLEELRQYGEVTQFKVCQNEEQHLRGNVYAQFATDRQAILAYRALNGRYYGGKQINVEFCTIPRWSKAICGMNFRNQCPKGRTCNFLHVFRNPNNEFINVDKYRSPPPEVLSERKNRDWKWSPSPEPISERYTRSDDRKKDKKYKEERMKSERHRGERQSERNSDSRKKHKRRDRSSERKRKRKKSYDCDEHIKKKKKKREK